MSNQTNMDDTVIELHEETADESFEKKEQGKKRHTIYEYNQLNPLVKGEFEEQPMSSKDSICEKFELHEYGQIERTIFHALDRYKYLNSYNLTEVLNSYLKENRQHKSYENIFRKMVQDGVLGCYKLGFEEGSNTLCAYYNLSVVSEYLERPERVLSREDSVILERLSLNQWHIHVEHLPDILKAEYYRKFDEEGEAYKIPSVITIPLFEKENKKALKTGLRAFLGAYPAPKGELDEESQLLFGKRVHNALSLLCKRKQSGDFGAITIICDSKAQIKRTQEILSRFEEIENDCVLYSLDMNTIKNPLKYLYHCEIDEKGAVITTKVDFKKLAAGHMT